MPIIDVRNRYLHSNYCYIEIVFDNLREYDGSILVGVKNFKFGIKKDVEYYSVIGSGGHPYNVPEKKKFLIQGSFAKGISTRSDIEKKLFRSAISTYYNDSFLFTAQNEDNLSIRSSLEGFLYTEDGNITIHINLLSSASNLPVHRYTLTNVSFIDFDIEVNDNAYVMNNVQFKAGDILHINNV